MDTLGLALSCTERGGTLGPLGLELSGQIDARMGVGSLGFLGALVVGYWGEEKEEE